MSGNKESDGGWRTFLWNSEKGEFLGRTGCSWFKIILFYVIFYLCLAGIFVGTIQALLLTLNSYKPTYQDRVAPPGLSHTPRSDKSEISFSMSDNTTFNTYIEHMNKLLTPYDDGRQADSLKYEDCGDSPRSYIERGSVESDKGQRKACRFSRALLGSCSGLIDGNYGFRDGKPCLIIKLNRIVNFRPKNAPFYTKVMRKCEKGHKTFAIYLNISTSEKNHLMRASKPFRHICRVFQSAPANNQTLPDALQAKALPNMIPIFCKHKRDEDADKIGEIKYFGLAQGFPLQYYPYYGKQLQPQYLQPLVAIQFANVTIGKEVRAECKIFGENIKYSEKDRYQGRFDVKLTINS